MNEPPNSNCVIKRCMLSNDKTKCDTMLPLLNGSTNPEAPKSCFGDNWWYNWTLPDTRTCNSSSSGKGQCLPNAKEKCTSLEQSFKRSDVWTKPYTLSVKTGNPFGEQGYDNNSIFFFEEQPGAPTTAYLPIIQGPEPPSDTGGDKN